MFHANDPTNSQIDAKCPVCGSDVFEWGRMSAGAYYVPGSIRWDKRARQVIRVRRCLRCNNLMQFTDQDLTRRQAQLTTLIVVVSLIIGLLAVALPIIISLSSRR